MSELRLTEEEMVNADTDVPVLDDTDAEYLLEVIKMANSEYDKMAAHYARMMERARDKRDRTIEWAQRNLRPYLDIVPAKQTKTQVSYELPSGKLVLKKQEPEYKRDNDQLVEWLEGEGREDLIKVEKSAKWADLKKELAIGPGGTSMVNKKGEIVPGVTVAPRKDKFTVILKEGEDSDNL